MPSRGSERVGARFPAAEPGVPVFGFERVSVSVDSKTILGEIDLDIPGSGLTAVLGASGSGKSTLTRLCNRLLDPSSGLVKVRGSDAQQLDVIALRRAIGMVFQRPTLFAGSVRDNFDVTGVTDPEAHASVLDDVDLDEGFLERPAGTLSGGESQRACLARTMLMQPEVLVADEPTASLDDASARTLEQLARRLTERGIPVLWVTHDLAQFDRIADHGVVLDHGRVAAVGAAADVRRATTLADEEAGS